MNDHLLCDSPHLHNCLALTFVSWRASQYALASLSLLSAGVLANMPHVLSVLSLMSAGELANTLYLRSHFCQLASLLIRPQRALTAVSWQAC